MLESALTRSHVGIKRKIAYKTLISAGLIALAVFLPQGVHLALGQSGGVQWLPMYLPVLIGGCLLGNRWALAVGVLSPLVSFAVTSAAGEPMPAAARLPFMIAELAVFAAVSGLFGSKIVQNGWWAFPAVLSAQIAGRGAFLGLVALFQSISPLTPAAVWGQIVAGWKGLLLQAILVPLIIIVLRALLLREDRRD